ncbi:hypothetical protein SAMN04515674_101100 [Pseudarcicella hirudinis]|uniref:N-acetyltransferase domain-containing protein n=1 Tax=Pseudarcicella hirudinis TaxID=1079859 RepID=A0A1I5M2V1_9BACT|nr:GNAT family N-acetyltransferase [Pseudarcicella hirudinis]SFP03882.1 hypothetical protein SAMN04515674_101100 [Pseudarcicella hirudinis]
MNNQIINNTENNRFELSLDNGDTAFVEYSLREDKIAFLHTEVPAAYEGKGIAAALAKYVLEYAKSNHLRVIPICPYIKAYIQRHPDSIETTH